MKSAKFLLVIIVSFFFLTNQIKATTQIKKEYVSGSLGLLSLLAGIFNHISSNELKNDFVYKNRITSNILISSGITGIISTIFSSNKISRKEIGNYLLYICIIAFGYYKYTKDDNLKEKIKGVQYWELELKNSLQESEVNGILGGIGFGLLSSTLINCLALHVK